MLKKRQREQQEILTRLKEESDRAEAARLKEDEVARLKEESDRAEAARLEAVQAMLLGHR